MHANLKKTAWPLACAFVALLYVFSTPVLWQCEGVDELEYLSLAHSLANGDGYTINGQPHVLYPPLFPGFLSLFFHNGPPNWRCLYAFNALLGISGLILLASYLRRNFGEAGRWAAWFSLVAYYPWSFSTRYLLSEPLYFLLSSITLIAAHRFFIGRGNGLLNGAGVTIGALLAAMTRVGSLSLGAGFVVACFLKRKKIGWVVALLMGLFFIYWEVRAGQLNPDASETYGRWLKKIVGISTEQSGMIAQNVGEGTTGVTSLPDRFLLCGIKYGQFVLSLVRIPSSFAPLGLLLFMLFLVGLVVALKKDKTDPFAWYTLFTIAMICMTSWVSSYHRYLYPLTPFLFYFLFLGILRLSEKRGAPHFVFLVCGIVGLGWALKNLLGDYSMYDAEQMYLVGVKILLIGFYAAMLFVGVARRLRTVRALQNFLWLALVLYATHSLAVGAQRFHLTRQKIKTQLEPEIGKRNNPPIFSSGDAIIFRKR